jgi:hypothetical protein
MNYMEINPLQNSTIMRMFYERKEINTHPPYQRMSGVWTVEKKQLLLDSILNEFDIPKIYFHVYNDKQRRRFSYKYTYAIIDGQQRMNAIWEFMEGNLSLADDFEYFEKKDLEVAGLKYDELGLRYPKLKINFDSYVLPIIGVRADDENNIEDMFLRLNEAVPLNAAEKRNAFSGNLVNAIREISESSFFKKKVKFPNKRLQHYEIACRFLLLEEQIYTKNRIVDTKKHFLDNLAKSYQKENPEIVEIIKSNVAGNLSELNRVFIDSDSLLRAQGIMTVYYLLFRKASKQKEINLITREKLQEFQNLLRTNRDKAQADLFDAEFDLLEFDRLSQQGTNDASGIKERLRILSEFLNLTNPEKI